MSLFKQHPGQLDEHHPAVAAAMRYWSEAPEAGGELFRFYANGKSIVRVHEAIREAGSVHEWNLPSKHVAATAAIARTEAPSLTDFMGISCECIRWPSGLRPSPRPFRRHVCDSFVTGL